MYIDKYRCIALEQCKFPGSVGDSCSETSRYAHLKMLLGDYNWDYDLNVFKVYNGFVRHPELEHFIDSKGVSWGASDTTSDQMLPLYLASRKSSILLAYDINSYINNNWYRTGNGDLISPGLYAELKDSQLLRTPLLVGQVGLFHFKYRWNDEKNKFEETEGSACDYLNFIHVAVYAPAWVRKLTDKEILKQKVRQYYKDEPNAFVVPLYEAVLDKYWS